MTSTTIRNICLIWLAWSVIVIGYMQLAPMRYEPNRPDEALIWSAGETNRRSNLDDPYLLDPMLNSQVAWDSEYYLSVATVGYDDPLMELVAVNGETGYSKSYAFFPLYPYLMKIVRLPFVLIGVSAIGASAIAGVLIALLGTLGGMIALVDLVRDELGEDGGIRTAYLMLIFPTAVFFSVIYTEGLFIGLAFGSLALMRRKQLLWAAILAALATWTRAVGGVLIVPLLLTWWLMYRETIDKRDLWMRLPLMLSPLFAYGIWRIFFGVQFDYVEDHWFGNGLLQFETTFDAWRQTIQRAQEFPETFVIVLLGIAGITLAVLSCLLHFKRYPQLALFGLIALFIPLTGGWTGTQSALRYILAVPTLWIMLGHWSKNVVFERAWTTLSLLLFAMQAFLLSFDFWVA